MTQPAAAAAGQRKGTGPFSFPRLWRRLSPYILVSPAVSVVLLIVAFPLLRAIIFSLQHYQLTDLKNVHFIGLANYLRAFREPLYWSALRTSLVWVVGIVSFQFVFGLLIALLLNQTFRGRALVRAVVLIPWVVPSAIVGLLWKWIYDGNVGVLNDLFKRFGLISTNVPWLTYGETALPAVMVAVIWAGTPFFAIMLLAALQAVPGEVYEAADVDGASEVQQFFYVTIPSIMSTIRTTTLLRIIWVANYVDIIWILTGGGPGYATTTLPVLAFVEAMRGLDFGFASAISITLALLLVGVVALYLRSIERSRA